MDSAVLTQVDTEGNWKLVVHISKAMTVTKQWYALVTMWACELYSDYLISKTLHIETEHKPLGSFILEEK